MTMKESPLSSDSTKLTPPVKQIQCLTTLQNIICHATTKPPTNSFAHFNRRSATTRVPLCDVSSPLKLKTHFRRTMIQFPELRPLRPRVCANFHFCAPFFWFPTPFLPLVEEYIHAGLRTNQHN